MPEPIRTATAGYRAEMDVLGTFLGDRCVVRPNVSATAKELYAAYVEWCEETGEKPLTQKAIGQRLAERGLETARLHGGVRAWKGIALRDEKTATQTTMDDDEDGDPFEEG